MYLYYLGLTSLNTVSEEATQSGAAAGNPFFWIRQAELVKWLFQAAITSL